MTIANDYMLYVYPCDVDDRVLRAISDDCTIQAISNINETKMVKDINSLSIALFAKMLRDTDLKCSNYEDF